MSGPVSAILLAAGSSQRMGAAKTLLPFGDLPAVRLCAETLFAAGIGDVVVVTGPTAAEVEKALRDLPVQFIRNNLPKAEMADSVRLGLKRVSFSAAGILVCLSDHPLVSRETICTLLQANQSNPEKIIVPAYNNRNGHPALFPRPVMEEIFKEDTLRVVVRKDPSRLLSVAVDDEGVILDMDTPEDYLRMVERQR